MGTQLRYVEDSSRALVIRSAALPRMQKPSCFHTMKRPALCGAFMAYNDNSERQVKSSTDALLAS